MLKHAGVDSIDAVMQKVGIRNRRTLISVPIDAMGNSVEGVLELTVYRVTSSIIAGTNLQSRYAIGIT